MPLGASLTLCCLAGLGIQAGEAQRSLSQRQAAQILVRAQAFSLERQLHRSLSATVPLAEIVQRTGTVAQFDPLAAEIIRSYGGIVGLDLAPQGGVRQIYPHTLTQLPEAQVARDPSMLLPFTLYPVPLESRGRVRPETVRGVGRLPVFLTTPNGQRQFWGEVSVQIRLDLLLHAAQMHWLTFNGYDYALSYLDTTTQKWVVFTTSSAVALVNPVSSAIALPKGSWVLEIAPQGGWQPSPQLFIEALFAGLVSIALGGSLWVQQRDRQRGQRAIAQTQQTQAALHEHLTQTEQHLQQTQQDLTIALTDLATLQAHLINAKKLATLGQLLAAITHDVNTPLSAIRAANGNLSHTLDVVLPQLPQMLQSLDASQVQCFFAIIQSAPPPSSTSRQQRQWRHAIAQHLQPLPHALDLANTLVDLGITQDIQPYIPLLKAPNASKILRLALALKQLQHNSKTIGIAAAQAAKILFAVKSYSHQAPVESPKVLTYIPDHLDTTLTLYAHQLKQGMIVERHYDPLPPILCYPDELSQVWTNLIQNAIQAMPSQGRLTLQASRQTSPVPTAHPPCVNPDRASQDYVHSTTKPAAQGEGKEVQRQGTGDFIVISITDNGPGIPLEVMPHIFDPFFTTKPMGEGSGLGLDISYKIIQKHQGHISVNSQPGATTFRVWLPMIQIDE
jgi:signal transduction histidine kinase